ncbi:hypothetical protein E2C01_033854 [Portunus trituberculatus]|uniref:Uncharacterized protein n=1 Tax=Portunus trituberculatus TaxID=210409 RepID=A0A5B7F565_PORTR|nr:hypothetical protein [Portunus trituberculatus]
MLSGLTSTTSDFSSLFSFPLFFQLPLCFSRPFLPPASPPSTSAFPLLCTRILHAPVFLTQHLQSVPAPPGSPRRHFSDSPGHHFRSVSFSSFIITTHG